MCDRLRSRDGADCEIEHIEQLSDNIGSLFLSDEHSDITLIVEKHRFSAHKVILAARSEYFRAMLFGGMREASSECHEIELKDAPASAFRYLLRYIYTSKMNLTEIGEEEELLDILELAHKYGFEGLEMSVSDYLKATLSIKNVCLIYDLANLYGLHSLCETCFEFMDRNASDILLSDNFYNLSKNALEGLISRDSFCAPEMSIFDALCKWVEGNSGETEDAKEVMKCVRYPLISIEDLFERVRSSGKTSPDCLLDAIHTKHKRDMDLNYRGFLVPEENVATLRHGAKVIHGEMKMCLLDGDSQNYDLDRGFTRHPVDDNNGQGVVVKLASPYILNTIKLLLWDRDTRSYSYYIELSMDETDWIRVVDHRRYLCRSWQYLHFKQTVAKYVRIVGTHNTVNRVFHLVAFECMYSKHAVDLHDGIIVPKDNVATTESSACVIEGVSRSRNALINGDTRNYDWDSGYTCHQLGSGAIVVQLAQPYYIGSMRLLLWDCDNRNYSYYIEVSVDQQTWHLVADFRNEARQSWQVIQFPPQPICFVRIVGTNNTANEVFHCVHFECPCNPQTLKEYKDQKCTNKQKMSPPNTNRRQSPPNQQGPRDQRDQLVYQRDNNQGLHPHYSDSDEDGIQEPYMHPPPLRGRVSPGRLNPRNPDPNLVGNMHVDGVDRGDGFGFEGAAGGFDPMAMGRAMVGAGPVGAGAQGRAGPGREGPDGGDRSVSPALSS